MGKVRQPLFADGGDLPKGDAVLMTELMTEESDGIETAGPEALDKDPVELERFMQEDVVITIAPASSAPGEARTVVCGSNGKTLELEKGKTYKIKRYFVESLLRGKQGTFEQRFTPGEPDRSFFVESRSQSYSFMLKQDTPKGQEWFNRIAQSPV